MTTNGDRQLMADVLAAICHVSAAAAPPDARVHVRRRIPHVQGPPARTGCVDPGATTDRAAQGTHSSDLSRLNDSSDKFMVESPSGARFRYPPNGHSHVIWPRKKNLQQAQDRICHDN